jgi:glycosyltransferase involved in cell wall biosynthesis
MSEGYILWVGNVFTAKAVERYRGIAASSNYWRKGLLGGLQAADVNFRVLGHRNEQAWPKGMLFPNDEASMEPAFPSTLVKWINLPGVRYPLLARAHVRAYKKMVKQHGLPLAVLTYNPYPWHVPLAHYAQQHGVKWVSITLDYDHVDGGWSQYESEVGAADGHVFLSHWAYKECPCPAPKLHLDGGFEEWFGDTEAKAEEVPKQKRTCLYSGKYTNYGGYELLLDTIRSLEGSNIVFQLTGKASAAVVTQLKSFGDRVEYYGFVDDAKLHELTLNADVLFNPRPSHYIENRVAFPSKLVRYLAYAKPIVSTWTDGLAPEYRDLLIVPEEETGASLGQAVLQAADYNDAEKAALASRVRDFLMANKSWKKQAERLRDWLESDLLYSKNFRINS